MSHHKMDGFGGAPQTERHSSSDSSQESSFIEVRAARTLARVKKRDQSAASVSSRDSSALSSGLLSPTVCSDCTTLRPQNEDAVSMGDGDASLAESMRTLGQLGSPDDWDFANLVPRYDGVAAPAHPEHGRPPLEFSPQLPPTTFPGLAPSPLLAPVTAYASATRPFRAPSAPVRARGPPLSLLDPQMMMRGAAAAMMGGEQMMAGAHPLFDPSDLSPAALQQFLLMTMPSYLREAWSMEQNAPPPSRRVRLYSTARSNRRSSCSSNSTDGSNSSRQALDCSYCRSVSKDPSGHNKYNCPILADLPPCRICEAKGKDNHTEMHCPRNPKIDLQFIPKTRRVRAFTL